jgi:dTDP-glucose 4,6-dehydratase
MSKNILITGACGFIGHHLVDYLLKNSNHHLYLIDKLSYASCGLDRLRELNLLNNPRIHLFIYDLITKIDEGFIKELENINWIIHLAAETHVDNSIKNPRHIIMNNILSTLNLLEFARKLKQLDKFIYFSTDEVYGPAVDKCFKETDKHNPTNPYSASKSASEVICNSYANTFNIPLIICNVMNVFGERQHNEKFIPLCIKNILNEKSITIHTYPYVDGEKPKSGSRYYIYVENVASAVYFIMCNGKINECYNIKGQEEISNDELFEKISNILNKTTSKIYSYNDINRPGHDLRYSLDNTKLTELGWKPEGILDDYLEQVVNFTVQNTNWM